MFEGRAGMSGRQQEQGKITEVGERKSFQEATAKASRFGWLTRMQHCQPSKLSLPIIPAFSFSAF